MRISTNYIYSNINLHVQTSIKNLLNVEEIMATQRKLNHLSDDPVSTGRVLNIRGMISQQEQFIENQAHGQTMAELYDGSFDSTIELLKRTKELLLGQASSAASTDATREASRIEIVSLASQLSVIGNLQYADRFLFAGYNDDEAPFDDMSVAATQTAMSSGGTNAAYQQINDPALVTGHEYELVFTSGTTFDIYDVTTATPVVVDQDYVSGELIAFHGISLKIEDETGGPVVGDAYSIVTTPAGAYSGDSGVISIEVEQDVFQQVNVTGERGFLGEGIVDGVNIFEIFQEANEALRANDQEAIQELLTKFDQASDQIGAQQSLVGVRYSQLEKSTDRLLDVKLDLEVLLSELQDTDITEAVTELNRQENAYQAVLGAAGKIIQPQLLDFLG